MDYKDRTAEITIGGDKYELLLTTRATKEIAAKYGGLDNLGENLLKSGSTEEKFDDILWMITLLANQPIMIDNLKNKADKPLITVEELEILTTPADLGEYADAIFTALQRGTKREVISEPDLKNSQVG